MPIQFIENCHGSSRSLAVSHYRQNGKPSLVVVPNHCDLDDVAMELSFYTGIEASGVHVFPDLETLPYDTETPSSHILNRRAKVFAALASDSPPEIIVTNVNAIMMHVAGPAHWLETHIQLSVGQEIDPSKLQADLEFIGYEKQPMANWPGHFCIHPNVIDIIAIGSSLPSRLRIQNGIIESISSLDVSTQRASGAVESIVCMPVREVPASKEATVCFRTRWRDIFEEGFGQPIYEAVSAGRFPAGIEYYLPLFSKQEYTLFSYLPEDIDVFILDGAYEEIDKHWRSINKRFLDVRLDKKRFVLDPEIVWMTAEATHEKIQSYRSFYIGDVPLENPDASFECFNAQIKRQEDIKQTVQMIRSWDGRAKRIAVTLSSDAKKSQIKALTLMAGRTFVELASWRELENVSVERPSVSVFSASIDEGFYDAKAELLLVTEREIFGYSISEKTDAADAEDLSEQDINDFMGIDEGERIVHLKYGVGEFQGLVNMSLHGVDSGVNREFMKIGYADSANAFVKMESLDQISRYGCIEDNVRPLDAMGSEKWLSDLNAATQGIGKTAGMLLKIQAERNSKRGMVMEKPGHKYNVFAAEFPFNETIDQKRAIADVIADLVSPRPMDRLVVGDVGFGKTEVAARAAFLAAVSGYQVVLLVPTTLLAHQHYVNFKTRFASFPEIVIDTMSRFTEDERTALSNLRNGKTNIVIGTHRLIQSDVEYQNLGLIIIDEEHRFGVVQKEQLRGIRANVNLLSMSATPIPRTLSMSLMGIRDVSPLNTPPAKRLSIRTYVSEYHEGQVCEAIDREMQRSGQVFFLHNVIDTIEARTIEMRALMPDVRFEFAHGKMGQEELGKIMARFYAREFDVLISTTIIEIGIDVPNANTMLIERADRMGLAQLHQLRGRVGRSTRQAYCYLLTPAGESITEDATKRLDAMVSASHLGGGSVLAGHDLEIRGAGEILGEEQSGHIMAIGYALYVRLMERAVELINRGRQVTAATLLNDSMVLEVNLSGFIPADYIDDHSVRLSLYKRISTISKKEQINKLLDEMEDRFGTAPEETLNLLICAILRIQMRDIGIDSLIVDEMGGKVEIRKDATISPPSLIEYCEQNPNAAKMDSPWSMRFYHSTDSREDRIGLVLGIMETLVNIESQSAAA